MLNIFVMNSIYRSVAFIPVFLAFSVHDCYQMPYKHTYLNYLQMLSSVSLSVINACNVLASFSIVFNLMIVPAMEDMLSALKYIEFVMLAAVPLSLIVWKIIEHRKKYSSNHVARQDKSPTDRVSLSQ